MHRIALHSAIGPRESLEDTALACHIAHPHASSAAFTALLVFDGVGGNQHGELASALAQQQTAASLAACFARPATPDDSSADPPDAALDALINALQEANRLIVTRSAEEPRLQGMATTVVAGVIVGRAVVLAWAGDSRCYRIHRDWVEQLTVDHTEVEQLIGAGLIARDEARDHPLAHIITNCLGKGDFQPQTRVSALEPGDFLLLCTDGLTDVLGPDDIAAAFSAYRARRWPFDELPRRLVAESLRRGTRDNATCLCCEFLPSHASVRLDQITLTDAYAAALAGVCRQAFQDPTHV